MKLLWDGSDIRNTAHFPTSFKLFGFTWRVIHSTPHFVAAQDVYHLRPFTVFRYSLQNDAFVRDFSTREVVGDFYVSAISEYISQSKARQSLERLEDELKSYRKSTIGVHWAVIRDADCSILIELEDKEQAFDCAASLRRLHNEAVHVDPLFGSKPQERNKPSPASKPQNASEQ